MKRIIYLALFTLASLSCGVASTPPNKNATHTQEVGTFVNPATSTPETAQIIGSWNFREAPGESSPLIDTLTNQEVTLIHCKPYEGGQWCKVQSGGVTGWVNKKGLK